MLQAMQKLSIGQCATLACMLEVTAPKPGNVHRGSDFEDVTLNDFLASAVAIGPAMETAVQNGVGRTVLGAVQATRALVGTNTNLGMVLLHAPLAVVARERPLASGVRGVLAELTAQDAADVYEAINLARPGGLGTAAAMDVARTPPQSLIAAMEAAAGRDDVARQYATGFVDVFERVMPLLVTEIPGLPTLSDRIMHTHVTLLAERGDTLIARKCGAEVSQKASAIARSALAAGAPGSEEYHEALADLDFWLRSDGHRRNPGTTADLIAAGLFVGLREGVIKPPWR
jgi:triphosphoribosyl-dephospho-CoA synthase